MGFANSSTLRRCGFGEVAGLDINLASIAGILSQPMDNAELDRLREAYKDAVEKWITAIRAEEALASPDHSIHAWDLWEQAGFAEGEARKNALAAKRSYECRLREADYGIRRTDL